MQLRKHIWSSVFFFFIANLVFSSLSFLLEWAWDATSDLIKQGMFTLSGIDDSIATKIDANDDYDNCMMTGPVMEGTGKHTIHHIGEVGERWCESHQHEHPANFGLLLAALLHDADTDTVQLFTFS